MTIAYARRMSVRTLLLSACVFTLIAALSRWTLRTIETRWHVLALWAVAGAWQFALKPALGFRPSGTIFAADVGVVLLVCATVKWLIEGSL